MPREESTYPMDWLRIAEKDLRRAQHLLEIEDAEAAGFFLQQALEKYLKAFLLGKGWELKRIHDLEALLNAALEYDATLEVFRPVCQRVTGFYFAERYPILIETSLTVEDVLISIEESRALINRLKSILERELGQEKSQGSDSDEVGEQSPDSDDESLAV